MRERGSGTLVCRRRPLLSGVRISGRAEDYNHGGVDCNFRVCAKGSPLKYVTDVSQEMLLLLFSSSSNWLKSVEEENDLCFSRADKKHLIT